MPQLILAAWAQRDLIRLREFFREKNPLAARRAADAIKRHVLALTAHPEIGRPWADDLHLRELPIPFGDTGYVVLYRHVAEEDAVVILSMRHQKEAGY